MLAFVLLCSLRHALGKAVFALSRSVMLRKLGSRVFIQLVTVPVLCLVLGNQVMGYHCKPVTVLNVAGWSVTS